jgi:hypothetical protein
MVGPKVAGTLRVPSAKIQTQSDCRQQKQQMLLSVRHKRSQLLLSERRLSTSFLRLGVALANLELRIALANHVNPAAATHNLAIRVAVLQRTDTANNFHGY